jgi:hypothetical protein
MSDPDKTDQDKGFLARWSQRKQEAKQPEPKQDAPAAAAPVVPAEPPAEAEPELDLSSLPKLEELTGTTDITAFLKKGVPEQLRNAALRKSWALDPAIRNYVNPALEYAYDWNTPGGVPGGGELGAGVDVARLVSQIMGQPAVDAVSSDASLGNEADITSARPSESDASQQEFPVKSLRRTEEPEVLVEHGFDTENAANESTTEITPKTMSSAASQQPVRRHGSAKPIG